MNKLRDLVDFLDIGKPDYEMFGTPEKVRKFAEGLIEATKNKYEKLRIAHARDLVSDNYHIKIRG